MRNRFLMRLVQASAVLVAVAVTDSPMGTAQQAPKAPAPSTAPPQPGQVFQPVTDWIERASREYQDAVVKELSIPTGKVPVPGPPSQSADAKKGPASGSSEPGVVERIQGWLGIETAKVPTTKTPPAKSADGKAPPENDAKALSDEMIRRQVEARRQEQAKVAEDERIATETRKAREAVDAATLQRQKAAEAERQAAQDGAKAMPEVAVKPVEPVKPTPDAERKPSVAAAAADKAEAERKAAAEAERKARLAEAEKAASEKAAAEKQVEAERKTRQAAADKAEAEKKATADAERKARLAETERAAADTASDKQAAETERKAKLVESAKAEAAKALTDRETKEKLAAERERKSAADKTADGDKKARAAAAKGQAETERLAQIATEKERVANERQRTEARSRPPMVTAGKPDDDAEARRKSAATARAERATAERLAQAANKAGDRALDKRDVEGKSKMSTLASRSGDTDRPRRNRCARAGEAIDPPGTYTVKSGDTLWGISRRHYDKGRRYEKIVRANEAKISSPELIFPCQRFYIPAAALGLEPDGVQVMTSDAVPGNGS